MKCPNCGTPVRRSDRHCGNCGRRLGRTPPWLRTFNILVISVAAIIVAYITVTRLAPSSTVTPTISPAPPVKAGGTSYTVPILLTVGPNTTVTPAPTVYGRYLTGSRPVIDGRLGPGEWQDPSVSQTFRYVVPEATPRPSGAPTPTLDFSRTKTGPMLIYLMNDDDALYFALTASAPGFNRANLEKDFTYFKVELSFDGNRDDLIGLNDDSRSLILGANGMDKEGRPVWATSYYDLHLGPQGNEDPDIKQDRSGVMTLDDGTGTLICEATVPLNSGEKDDLAVKPGEWVSLQVKLTQYRWRGGASSYVAWPERASRFDIGTYGKLVLASSSKPQPTPPWATSETAPSADVTVLAESAHPYPANCDYTWTIAEPRPGGSRPAQMRLHFAKVQTMAGDHLYMLDKNDRQLADLATNASVFQDLWTDWYVGETLKLRLLTNGGGAGYGFVVDARETSEMLPPTWYLTESLHPYANNYSYGNTLSAAGAAEMRLHFLKLQIMAGDHIYLKDKYGKILADITTDGEMREDWWSEWYPFDSLLVHLQTDGSRTGYGHIVDKIDKR